MRNTSDIIKELDKFLEDPVFGKLINRNAAIGLAKYFYDLGVEDILTSLIEEDDKYSTVSECYTALATKIREMSQGESKTKALFTLTFPRVNTWNGKWIGDNNVYCKDLTILEDGKPVYPNLREGNYMYDFRDGWEAEINVRFVTPTEARNAMEKSDGFCGYEWMIDNICLTGKIL